MKKNSSKFSLLIFFLLVLVIGIVPVNFSSAQTDVKILCFIENGFGGSYYINKGLMENYNWSITTASSQSFVTGCKNNGKNITDTYSDILVSDIDEEDLSEYDCVFVPSGGHWSNVIAVLRVLEIIEYAHESNIFVAGICTGMIVLANTNILDGVQVAYNIHATSWLSFAGANMTGYPVVSDQGIITGGFGGGTGSGPEGAPNELFCEKIKEEIDIRKEAEKSSIFITFIMFGLISLATISYVFKQKITT